VSHKTKLTPRVPRWWLIRAEVVRVVRDHAEVIRPYPEAELRARDWEREVADHAPAAEAALSALDKFAAHVQTTQERAQFTKHLSALRGAVTAWSAWYYNRRRPAGRPPDRLHEALRDLMEKYRLTPTQMATLIVEGVSPLLSKEEQAMVLSKADEEKGQEPIPLLADRLRKRGRKRPESGIAHTHRAAVLSALSDAERKRRRK
jgi:hypothetical protein